MKIRKANKFDFPEVYQMLLRAKQFWPISLRDEEPNEEHIRNLFNQMVYGAGVILVAEKEGQLIGLVMGMIVPMTWFPNHRVLHELTYWVDEEHRGSTAGYRLLAQYVKEGKELIEEGRVTASLLGKMDNSPNLKYDKFGYQKVEEFWAMGV